MSVARVDGVALYAMLENGLALLEARTEYINNLNVFPVADGDTGTNMAKTLAAGLRESKPTPHVGQLLRAVSRGMLLGARGNSGVILSQFFRGMADDLSRQSLLGPGELRNGLVAGYQAAYLAVAHPVEGTMLTVCRQGIEGIRPQITRRTPVDTLLAMYIAEMKKSLAWTPELLPELKEASVVDSGGYGLVCIFEGMHKALFGEKVARTEVADVAPAAVPTSAVFDENTPFEEGYCLEFVLQLMKVGDYNPRFELNKFIADLQLYGNSIVAVQDGRLVKVHIHTHHLSRTLSLCEEFGVFVDFKVDNMQLQKNAKAAAKPKESLPLGKIAFPGGAGFGRLFEELGCEKALPGEGAECPSTSDFLSAIEGLNAKKTVVFPNQKNAVAAAQAAAELAKEAGREVVVIPTANPVEGYFALAMDIPDWADADGRIGKMQTYAEGLSVLALAVAQKPCETEILRCDAGDWVAFCDGRLTSAAKAPADILLSAMHSLPDVADKASCLLFEGQGATAEITGELQRQIASAFPDLEIEILNGEQAVWAYFVALV